MKKIALTQRLIKHNTYFEIRDALDINWGKLVDILDFEPLILPIEYDFKKLNFDGLILTGGNDLNSVSGDEIDKKRDDFEKALIKHCIELNIPMYGVCRGLQIVNEYFGGTLKRVENHAAIKHTLDSGKEANSYHNYAADKLGEGLEILAKSQDGVIEVIKHKEYKIYAQMHHPERDNPFDAVEIEFIRGFFNA